MQLSGLLKGFLYQIVQGDETVEITELVQDSRKVTQGAVFVCIRGGAGDGHQFIDDAAALGAAVIVIDENCGRTIFPGQLTVIRVWNTRTALAKMAAACYGWPARHMKVIGITGTKGKTTTAYMLFHILKEAGYQAGLIGTIEIYDGKESFPAENTTPDALVLHAHLHRMQKNGCRFVVMEVSSQALMLHRTDGILFDTAVFTNLGMDHISKREHKNFDEYKACKSKLFSQCRRAVLNGDDRYWRDMLCDSECEYALFGRADFEDGAQYLPDYCSRNEKLLWGKDSLGVEFQVSGRLAGSFSLDLPGAVNVENALAALAAADAYGVPAGRIGAGLRKTRIRGRCELLPVEDDAFVIIDYAHNAMSLEGILHTLRAYGPQRIVCIFGCGGGRSDMRREEMGEVSGRLSDITIITTDNPREEDPSRIMQRIQKGVCRTGGKYIMIEDRRKAIYFAIENRKPGDFILIAGKGHENYQEIHGVKYPMDDREMAEGAIHVCRRYH